MDVTINMCNYVGKVFLCGTFNAVRLTFPGNYNVFARQQKLWELSDSFVTHFPPMKEA